MTIVAIITLVFCIPMIAVICGLVSMIRELVGLHQWHKMSIEEKKVMKNYYPYCMFKIQ